MREKTRPSSPALTAAAVGREPGKAHSSQKRDRWGIGSSRTPSEGCSPDDSWALAEWHPRPTSDLQS